MKNPFDNENEKLQFEMFSQITQSVDKWMLEKYPLFDTSLENRIRKCEMLNDNLSKTIQEFRKFILDANQQEKDNTINEINRYLKEEYPKLDKNLILIANRLEKKSEELNKDLKKIVKNENLYKDVYEMRDEMEILRKSVNEFTERLKKVFK
jgi:methyl-accepting chemotaxis protein